MVMESTNLDSEGIGVWEFRGEYKRGCMRYGALSYAFSFGFSSRALEKRGEAWIVSVSEWSERSL